MATRPKRPKRQFANQDVDTEVSVRKEGRTDAQNLCADWMQQIKLAEERNEKWNRRSKRIIKRYREDRQETDSASGAMMGGPKRMNILWSNVQTLLPCVYGREPAPIAERRFLDKDSTGRVASQILERALRYEMNFCGFHDTVEQCVLDYLLVGRGVPWIRYKPIIGQSSSLTDRGDDQLTDKEGEPVASDDLGTEVDEHNESDQQTDVPEAEKLLSASLDVDYIHWEDFLHSKCRFWKENTWVARRLYPSRKDMLDDFDEDIARAVPLEMNPEQSRTTTNNTMRQQGDDSLKKAIVYEIWDKPTRKVYTVAKGYDSFLEEPREDPLNLEGFWPCPKPLFATMTNDTLEPVADYIEYQDQAMEIDELTNRIDLLIGALKVVGVYDAANKQLARLLDEGGENKMIAVSSWAAFAEKGGLKSAVSFLPIEEIGNVLKGLFDARDKIKADLFEITGLSDIIRGQADPRETAEAVSTKGKWGSLRLQARQANVARFCRDIIAMMGEVISEHFPDETLINVSGAMYDEGIAGEAPTPPEPPSNPMLGHNGGPPMGPRGGVGPMAPPNGAGMPNIGGGPTPGVPRVGLPQANQIASPSSLPMMAGPPAGLPSPAQPGAPLSQYEMQVHQYQMDMAKHQLEKQTLIANAIALLRQDKLRGFRIDIETDSTINADAENEKRSRTEFIKATTEFIGEASKLGMENPDAVPMLGKMLLFGVRGFRAGRDLESSIEEFVDKAEKDAKARQNSPAPPNPEVQKAQIDLQAMQAKSAAEVQKAQIDSQSSAEDNQRAIAQKEMDARIDMQKATTEQQMMQQDAAFKAQENAVKLRELELKMQIMEREHALSVQKHGHEIELMGREHSNALERAETEHKLHMEKAKEARKGVKEKA